MQRTASLASIRPLSLHAWRRWLDDVEHRLNAFADMHFVFVVDDDDVEVGQGGSDFHGALPAFDKQHFAPRIGGERIMGANGDRARLGGGLRGAWVEDVMVAFAIFDEGAFVVAGG